MTDRNSELMRYARGEAPAPKALRDVAAAAGRIYEEVQLARIEVDGAMVLAEHIMERALRLDLERRALAQDDPLVNAMLAEIQATALRQAHHTQTRLFSGW